MPKQGGPSQTWLSPPTSASIPEERASPERSDLARYIDRGLLARGGMGEVRRVWDTHLERPLAMKCLLPTLAGSVAARARFRNESRVTAGLDHPGVVAVYDAGETPDGLLWYTMRLVPGQQTLRRAMADGTGQRRTLAALMQVAEALAFAHVRGVVHRDVKPDNILVGEWGEVLLIDWGVARRSEDPPLLSAGSSHTFDHQTAHGTVIGTPPYYSPEQARGLIDGHGPWSDVWALGATLWEILTGTPLSRGRALGLEPEDLAWPEGVAHELRSLTEACLRGNPADRPRSAAPFAETLRRWLDAEDARGRARVLVLRAEALIAENAVRRAQVDALTRAATDHLRALGPRASEEAKRAVWEEEDAATDARREAVHIDTEAEQTLRAALEISPGLPEARARLADLYAERLREAEAERDATAAARAESMLRVHDTGTYRRWLAGTGAVSIVTDPPGASVRIARLELVGRRLVSAEPGPPLEAPVVAHELPRGSYVALLHAPGYAEVRYPFTIGRGDHWDGVPPGEESALPIRLPLQGEIGADEVYVPAGWALVGGAAYNALPHMRVWIPSFAIRREPVTNREYLMFLDELFERGLDTTPFLPRETDGSAGFDGPSPYGRQGGRFVLVADSQGDVWDPAWPVVQVGWAMARGYADWVASRTGKPWRLPWELEREKAARGVDGRTFPWGEQPEPGWLRCNPGPGGSPSPAPVGAFPVDTSVYGMRGAGGNVRDWCLDLRAAPPAATEGLWERPDRAPPGGQGVWRVLRGGLWSGGIDYGRCAARAGAPEEFRFSGFGFRLARTCP